MKKMISAMLVLILLLCALPVAAAAADEDVVQMIGELPDAAALNSMSQEQQLEVYNQTQAAYDAYLALSQQEQAAVEGAEAKFEALFAHFNSQVMALDAEETPAQEAEEEKQGLPWHYTALILALVTTVLQNKFIFNRNR